MAGVGELAGGVVHDLPEDLAAALVARPAALATWEDITPLARNEWICWVISPKKVETRQSGLPGGSKASAEASGGPAAGQGARTGRGAH
jgi:hypothetical protein